MVNKMYKVLINNTMTQYSIQISQKYYNSTLIFTISSNV